MIITKIERQKKNSSRRSIFLDEKYAFGVSEDILLKFNLYEGRELPNEEIEEIEKAETEQSVKTSAMRFRSYRPRSEKEIRDRLTKKGFDDPMIAKAIEYLSANNLLNDEEFARMFCRDKLTLKPVGKQAMKQQLFRKGIKKEIIEKVVEEFYTEESERTLAQKEAEKKYKRVASLPPLTIKRRLYEHLVRRGYDSSLSRSIVNQLVH